MDEDVSESHGRCDGRVDGGTVKKAASTMPKCLDSPTLVDGFLLRSSSKAVVSLDLCFRSIGMAIYSE